MASPYRPRGHAGLLARTRHRHAGGRGMKPHHATGIDPETDAEFRAVNGLEVGA